MRATLNGAGGHPQGALPMFSGAYSNDNRLNNVKHKGAYMAKCLICGKETGSDSNICSGGMCEMANT